MLQAGNSLSHVNGVVKDTVDTILRNGQVQA